MKLFISAIIGLILAACATQDTTRNGILREAVYEVTGRNCRGEKEAVGACEDIVLVELVKGNFYQIPSNQMAFVLWSGAKDSLNYVARKLGDVDNVGGQTGVVIFRDEDYIELLSFPSDGSVVYSFGGEDNLSSLYLRELSIGELKQYSKECPGSE